MRYPTLDALGHPRNMILRRWAWLIGKTNASDAELLHWAESFSEPASLEVKGARLDFLSYRPRFAARSGWSPNRASIDITPKPGKHTMNPVDKSAGAACAREYPINKSGEVMSARDRDQKNTLAASGYARRRFLERTALATMGVSAAALPSLSVTASKAETQSGKCPDVKIPMKDVAGKVAFITGGSSGIGLGIARAFADAGMKIIISYRTKRHLEEAMKYLESAGDRVHAIQLDVTDRPAMERIAIEAAQIFGKVHVLVNNAGVVLPPVLSATSYVDWDWVLNVNLNGPFNGIHTFLPIIRSHGEGGQIITTSSIMGLFAMRDGAAYTTSKFAVIGMMEALRAELIDANIGVSVFCPGLVKSNIEENSFRQRPSDSAVKDDPQLLEQMRQARDNPALAMNPLDAGNVVLRGMRNNDLYILSHPEYEFIIRDRSEALVASIPRQLQPTQKRSNMTRKGLETSIYSIERDRRLYAETCHAKVKSK